ncbi:MAG: YaaL family protein [Lachnospiraceae bacterium]|nr:YaaL family protein [Lachnospiraceae bacterium]
MLAFHSSFETPEYLEEDFTPVDLKKCIEKTRRDIDIAYAGFDNALDADVIDSYIYEINSLQKRYAHLTELAAAQTSDNGEGLYKHSPIRTIVSHVFG